jgi:hypothetical protein
LLYESKILTFDPLMSNSLRAILAVLAGVFAGGIVIASIQSLSPYRPPEEITPQNAAAFIEWVRTLPTEAYVYVLVSYLVGAFVAGVTTGWIALPTGYKVAWFAGLILLIFGIANFLAYPHPEWLSYTSCIGFVVFAALGGYVARFLKRT